MSPHTLLKLLPLAALLATTAQAATPSLWKNHYLDANGHVWVWGGGLTTGTAIDPFGKPFIAYAPDVGILRGLPTTPKQIASGFDRLENGFLYKTDGSAWKIDYQIEANNNAPSIDQAGYVRVRIAFMGYGITQLQQAPGVETQTKLSPSLLRRDGQLWDVAGGWHIVPASTPVAATFIGGGLYRAESGAIYRHEPPISTGVPSVFLNVYSGQPSVSAAWTYTGNSYDGDIGNLGLLNTGLGVSMAVSDQGTLIGWGSNINGVLLNTRTTDRTISEATPLGEGFKKSIFGGGGLRTTSNAFQGVTDWNQCGEGYIVALKQDGSIWSWGSNWAGQLGTGDTDPRPNPTQATAAGTDYIDLTRAGSCSMVGLKRDGTLWAWGEAKDSPLGASARATPDHLAFQGPGSRDSFTRSNTQLINTKPVLQAQQVVFPSATDMTIPTPALDIQATSTGPLSNRTITISFGSGSAGDNYVIAILPGGVVGTLTPLGWGLFDPSKPVSAKRNDVSAQVFTLTKDLDLTSLKGTTIYAGSGITNSQNQGASFFEMLAFGRYKQILTLQ